MRVAVVDIGSNSTRLLIADVVDGRVSELERASIVTRLGQDVDRRGELADEAMQRVYAVLERYRAAIERHRADAAVAVLTSAVRDARNGEQFTARVRERYGLDARVIDGAEEAALTFRGATSEREPPPGDEEALVIDIGGGSTELVMGRRGAVSFFASLQVGVVRMTERHLHDDPPTEAQLERLRDDVHGALAAGVPAEHRRAVTTAIAVAGTATQSAAIELGLEPYDPSRVHGHVLSRTTLERLLARLARLPNDERCAVPGLDPARAPTIVAGVAVLLCCVEAFGLQRVEVSEHDILRGAALQRVSA